MATDKPPILFLHGVFGRPALLQPWTEFFTAAGYSCHAPTLPGRDPTDEQVLRRTGIEDCFAVALQAFDDIDPEPGTPGHKPVVIGHSMGGLLGQKLAAVRDPAALVLLASIPPGVLWPQPKVMHNLLPVLPAILAGRPMLPSERTMRSVPLSTLPQSEQDSLLPRLARDSGRVFREMSLGTRAVRVDREHVRCPVLSVSAGDDRNVAPWISRRIAARYGAQQQVHPGLPHWIIAASAVDQVAPPVLNWLERTLQRGSG
ncbi:alpha/beta hydrolase [[Mycobacterium] wendilense]|uniref:Alpha/beta fold hydrolase n=1 Tax=[Mycobacterium] wendilense TaxID=3064284 RepID=A0ABM9MJH4_9MYCO|nr:alpha/beta fold hydrolase [Mycolicibacterium sp. MU0050]CAJ1586744.1 alpha/beta fold hydrolase [Mycolicibacterium sp. MU0050]